MTITADRAQASITGQRCSAEVARGCGERDAASMADGYACASDTTAMAQCAWMGGPDGPLQPGTGN